jgi:predicted metal-dependent hydrolase
LIYTTRGRRWSEQDHVLACHPRAELTPWLAGLTRDIGVRYRRVQIRNQRTRWGSC